jgi:glycosyltransferase involved in cell wall biosynthesis
MKIAIFDPYMPKFTDDMMNWWQAHGHEVRRERYYNPALVDWADVIWFETCDNNLHVATRGLSDHPDWPMKKRPGMVAKKVIVRVIDIEAWYGHHMNVDWAQVNEVVFIAPHIRQLVEKDINFSEYGVKVHVIPCGVNLDKFPLVEKPIGKKIAWVCEKWPTKGIDYALQVMAMLPKDYELHALGPWNDRYAWEKAYQEDFIERNDIKFFDYEWVPDVAEFLKDKDFILSCSKKEGFGYSIAEGMATGLIPVIHNFYGCSSIWEISVWDRVDDAAYIVEMYSRDPNFPRVRFREYLEKKGYTVPAMMTRFDEVMHGEG